MGPGIGIATLALDSIRKVIRTDILFHKNFLTNGTGLNILHHNPKFFVTFNMSRTNLICTKTSNSLVR